MTWGVKKDWRWTAVEIVKETEKTISFMDRAWGNRQTRMDKKRFLEWRGSAADANKLVAELESLSAEHQKRSQELSSWFTQRRTEILAPYYERMRAAASEAGESHE